MQKRIECKVFGRVQLVMYRDFATRKARKLGIVGEVENQQDGTVVVIGEGEEEVLQTFIALLRQGSLLSHVEHVDVVWKEATGVFTRFTLQY
jgi:acylphosphatase